MAIQQSVGTVDENFTTETRRHGGTEREIAIESAKNSEKFWKEFVGEG